jgi:predicted transcriptional regulator
MASAQLDAQVEAFIANCINSVEQFEILLLLRQRHELDADTINAHLRTSLTSVEKRLDDLARKDLVSKRDANGQIVYFYNPPERYKAIIDQLVVLYTTHRVAIINLIFSKPQDILKDFSEAFRLREKDK